MVHVQCLSPELSSSVMCACLLVGFKSKKSSFPSHLMLKCRSKCLWNIAVFANLLIVFIGKPGTFIYQIFFLFYLLQTFIYQKRNVQLYLEFNTFRYFAYFTLGFNLCCTETVGIY